ncbi:type 4a pilus biogenesis protein PilO [bacterium]|nr:type 4a pilus biogenesis protein PilO [bacterium]
MKILIVAVVLLLGYVFGFYWLYGQYKPIPTQISNVKRQIVKKQEELLSARILDQKLNKVAGLLAQNVALSAKDSLAKQGSVPFIDEMTEHVNRLGITLLNIEPERQKKIGSFVQTPYEIQIRTTYDQLAKLLDVMEKSPRLIYVNHFEITNDLNEYLRLEKKEDLGKYIAVLKINTLTLVKG